jgi:hypothetical protein
LRIDGTARAKPRGRGDRRPDRLDRSRTGGALLRINLTRPTPALREQNLSRPSSLSLPLRKRQPQRASELELAEADVALAVAVTNEGSVEVLPRAAASKGTRTL